MKCGKPVGSEEEYCRECSQRARMFTQGKGIFLYNDSWKLSLEKYKYYGCREYGDFYGAAITFYARKELERWQPDLIVPVPLHKKKERMRGFNQALYIAQQISRRTGIPIARDLVIKTKITKSQKKLSADQRRQNLKGAFRVTGSLNGKDVLVIDDVYTTGSTMDAMASCLRQSGAKNVYFLTVCMGFQ
jgi:ComF family protein